MADPISLAAIAGLIFAGRSLSKKAQPEPPIEQTPLPKQVVVNDDTPEFIERDFEPRVEVARKIEVTSFADIDRQQRSGGQEILNMRNRMYDTGRMNNLSPIEKQLVGPGLGVGADTPAQGGFQQMFRVNPINVGELTHNKPETTAFLPSRRPMMAGRAQGMSGAVPRASHQKTMRTTHRSETGERSDGLGFNGAKRFVPAQTMPQDPTRFKSDRNDTQFSYYSHAAPGITNFSGAYATSVASQMTAKNNEELMKYGFRPEDRRGKANRMGNPGRMNVRESALKQGGALTAVRSDTTRVDGRINAANGGWTQNYQQKPFHQFNAYKGHENPNSRNLEIAKRQLQNNPLAHHIG